MKTHQPKDFDATHQDDYRLGQGETHMGRDAQVRYAQTAIAWIVLVGAAVAAVWVML